MFNSFPGSLHSDVLNANPSNINDKSRLIEELRSRAKSSISSKNFPEAIKLYEKGLEVSLDTDNNGKAILHGNISMCYVSMNKTDDAIHHANESIKNDPQYVKAYYRKAQAYISQKQFHQAKEALLEGLNIKPDDKEIRQQLDKVQMEIVKSGDHVTDTNENKTAVFKTTTTSTTAPSTAPTQTTTTQTTTTTTTSTTVTNNNTTTSSISVEDTENEAILRGYKIVDGKKTTFFNHQLDDKTKELIGDIAPKRIDPTAIQTTSSNGSVWNSAGTFESVGYTSWAKETLDKILRDINMTIDDGSIAIKEVKEITGDAEIASNRGKRKHIYDMSVKLVYVISLSDKSNFEGEIKIDDITADREYEFCFSHDQGSPKYSGEIGKIILTKIKDGLKMKIIEKLVNFDENFKSK